MYRRVVSPDYAITLALHFDGYLRVLQDLVERGSRVLITGGSGFIGSNLVQLYADAGADVLNVDASPPRDGGSLGTNGSLEFIFDRKGVFNFPQTEGADLDEITLELIDAGAEDAELEDGYFHVTCVMEDFGNLQKKLDELGIEAEVSELQRIPNTMVDLSDEDFTKVMRLVDALEDDDDVQKVYHNINITQEQVDLV